MLTVSAGVSWHLPPLPPQPLPQRSGTRGWSSLTRLMLRHRLNRRPASTSTRSGPSRSRPYRWDLAQTARSHFHQECLGRRNEGRARQCGPDHRIHADTADRDRAQDWRQAYHGRRRFRSRPMAGERHASAGQHERRGYRPQPDQLHPGLAFSPRSCLGADGERHQRARLSQCRTHRQRHGIQMVDGARSGREAGRRSQGGRQAHRRRIPDVEELEARRG